MKRQSVALAALVFAAFLIASLAAAQETAQPKLFVLHQEQARPGMTKQYEEATKEYLSLVRQHHEKLPALQFVVMAREDFRYSYLTPLENYGSLDKVQAGYGAMISAVSQAKWDELMARQGAATELIGQLIMLEYPGFSYVPAKPRLKADEERYVRMDYHYVLPGREPDAMAVAQATVELYRKKGVADGFRLFVVQVGPEMPLLIVMSSARDAADFEEREKVNEELLGAEGKDLAQRAFAVLRRFETYSATVRPDLSIEPFKPKPGAGK
jgi:hypothetical protein